MDKQIIYVLINESMPGYVKIGMTTDLEQRIRSLDNTSAPLPFECFYTCTVNDMAKTERHVHDAFDNHRTRSNRDDRCQEPVLLKSSWYYHEQGKI